MRIGALAKAAGVGVETVRFYERKGLIEQPPRPFGSFRDYSQDYVERIQFVRQAQEIGFTLREIKELLLLRVDPAADCALVRACARSKLQEVIGKIAALAAMKRALAELIYACPGKGDLTQCSIIGALSSEAEAPHASDECTTDGRCADSTPE